jgi:L-fucose dehydrogenase
MRFQDRVVIVTGGAMGIGGGCCEVFAREGGRVAVIDRDVKAAESRLASLPGVGHQHWQVDVADAERLEEVIHHIAQVFGRIDCLINNAGVHPPDLTIDQMTSAEALRVQQVNFLSTYAASRAAMGHLKKTRGTIVNMSSMTAVLGQKGSTAYAASKGAQLSFTKALALEAAPYGVRVNAILPSNVDTPLMRQWAATLPDAQAALQRIAALQPLGRMAQPSEIGTIALFLATEDSSFLTGQGIEADGGAALDY